MITNMIGQVFKSDETVMIKNISVYKHRILNTERFNLYFDRDCQCLSANETETLRRTILQDGMSLSCRCTNPAARKRYDARSGLTRAKPRARCVTNAAVGRAARCCGGGNNRHLLVKVTQITRRSSREFQKKICRPPNPPRRGYCYGRGWRSPCRRAA